MRLKLVALLLASLAGITGALGEELIREDFSKFPAGWLSAPLGRLNAAIQEYHYLADRGVPLEKWENALCHLDAWVVGEEDGVSYLEQILKYNLAKQASPLFITGDAEWNDYTVEVKVKPLLTAGMAGVVFRYRTNRHYYLFSLSGGNRARLAVRLPLEKTLRVAEWRELGAAEFAYDTHRYYSLKVENNGPRIRAYVDGKLLIETQDSELLTGKAGVSAHVPSRFQNFSVTAANATVAAIRHRIAERELALTRLRAANPQPKLWKKFSTPGFGAGRNVRFGDLDGDGRTDMLIGQNVQRYPYDVAHISCLTAVTLDGKVLWQKGKPDERNGLLTYDTPFQIHDIDGDGRNEVVLAKDFKLQVLDGRTGHLLRETPAPAAPPGSMRDQIYEDVYGDSIAFVNVLGDARRHEILFKDRYKWFWVYDNQLRLLWKGSGQLGHYPYPVDVDGDGRDEIVIGYAMWSHDGRLLWSRDQEFRDHADGMAIANLSPDPKAEPRYYAGASDEGFLMLDLRGNVLKQVRLGHGQSPCIGKFRADVAGLQIATVNFWHNPGIVTLFDWQGNVVEQGEPIHSGSVMLPVNWRGDGEEFILLSASAREGGLIDGRLRRVVMLPDDGHPDLAAAVADLTGDERDEIVVWDQKQVWIYTQDRPYGGECIYAPIRNPDYNESNYRTNVSLPRWKERGAKPVPAQN
jgi:rhamnogalacturonan endolyase